MDGEGQDYSTLRLEYDRTKVPSGGAEVCDDRANVDSRIDDERSGGETLPREGETIVRVGSDGQILRAAKLAGRGRDSLSSFQNDDDDEEEEEEEEKRRLRTC